MQEILATLITKRCETAAVIDGRRCWVPKGKSRFLGLSFVNLGKMRKIEETFMVTIVPGWKKSTKITFPKKGNQERFGRRKPKKNVDRNLKQTKITGSHIKVML